MRYHMYTINFYTATLKASFLERTDIFIPKSFKIAKLNILIMQNNSLIYKMLGNNKCINQRIILHSQRI